MEELQISLTPARVEQKNFGLWLRTPQVGQVLNAVVADRLPSGEMILRVGAERVTASADIPLQPGARLLLEVKQVQPNITFRLLSNAPPPNIAAAEAMPEAMRLQRQASAAQPIAARTGLSALFALLGGLQSGPLQSVGIDRTALRQLQAGLLNAPDLARAETLQRALRSNGTFHEGMLASGNPELMRLAASDMKAQLLRMMAKVQAKLEEARAVSLAPEQVETLEQMKSTIEQGLRAVTQNQMGSMPAEQSQLSQQWLFDVPFRYGDQVYNLGVEISEDSASKSGATDPEDKSWSAKLSLAMPGLGVTELALRLAEAKVTVDVTSSERATLEMFVRSKATLTSGLESRGLSLYRLNVLHDPFLSRPPEQASLDIRA